MPRQYRFKVDLHGLNVESALQKIEPYLYQKQGVRIEIVHGCGHGILRKAVREFVAQCPCVERVDFGEEMNLPGGAGITVVYTYS